MVLKTFGVADHMREALSPLKNRIHAAFIYGSVARGTDKASSDIDLMLISDDLTYPDLMRALSNVEGDVLRPINPSINSLEEWNRKRLEAGGFVKRASTQPRVFLIGSDDDIFQA